MRVVQLSDGRVLYARNADRLFVPASNMKLFTTALALTKLGADYRLATQIGAEVPLDADGTLGGDLELIGGGDPSLSGREYPYRSHTAPLAIYSFRSMDELADQLIARGLKRVAGDVVGDDTRYVWEPQPGPWASDSATREYGAPVSALIIDDNTFALTLRPAARDGDLARIALSPPFENFAIENRVVTAERGERKIEFYRSASGRELHVWGAIPKGSAGYTQEFAIGDPALYAAEVLRDALLRRGISIRGQAVARHRFPDELSGASPQPAVVLAERRSPPLFELLQVVDKVSQNLHAEMLLREVAVAAGHPGSRPAGLAAMAEFLGGIGISSGEYQFTDGSGLSRATLVSPEAITKLLVYMNQSPHREEWFNLLPIGGEDGTLGSRFEGHPEARAIHAKTGTLDHVKAISGYADTSAYGRVAFSLLVNNFEEPGPAVRKTIDELVLSLLQ
jgi:D-alanyl-D-alanine carboxypeptidase/D-alanyl-D-alanine-endopeptidase (penicillin-binding protein 4)